MSQTEDGQTTRHGLSAQSATPTLDTWLDAPFSSWGFSHAAEIVPTAFIRRARPTSTPTDGGDSRLGTLPVPFEGTEVSLEQFLAHSATDALVVRAGNHVVYETYRGFTNRHTPHLLMSVSKSLCGLVIGQLVFDGALDLEAPASDYVAELAGSAFGEATLQQILDMTVAVAYSEDYHDPQSHVQTQDRLAGWRRRLPGDPEHIYAFLTSLQPSGPHGERFQYCSAGTDVLAWIIERVTGQNYPAVLSERLWQRLGAEEDAQITVDPSGFAFANGGVSATARDLSLVGRLMLDSGFAAGHQVVPAAWIKQTVQGGDPRLARDTVFQRVHPNGSYHNQWWLTGDDRGSIYGAGIHGQFLWVDPTADVVVVKVSSLPVATTERWSRAHAEVFRAICQAAAV